MISLQSIAGAIGGKVIGIAAMAAGPNGDLAVYVDSTKPDGFRVEPAIHTNYVRDMIGVRANGSGIGDSGVHHVRLKATKPKPTLSLLWADTSTWDSTPCPPREWAVRDRIPLRQVTLFSGEGAIGKSIVEMMLCVAHVLGKDWLGSLPEPGGAFYFGCEDDEPEQRIRFHGIAAHYGTTFEELHANGLRFKSLAGDDAILGAPDRNGIIKPTALYDQLYEEAGDLKPKHIGLDTSADVFAGSEIDRSQVRQFISLLRRLAIVANGSVVLLSHPSLTGINTGTGISGSTAWHNSVRARIYMTAPKIEPGEQPETDIREIQFKKSNYGPVADSMVLRYKNGLFLPEAGLSNIDKAAREATVDDAFLHGLHKLVEQGRDALAGYTSREYAPTLIAELPVIKNQGIRKRELEQAMERLLEGKKIHIGKTDGPSSKAKKRINFGPPQCPIESEDGRQSNLPSSL